MCYHRTMRSPDPGRAGCCWSVVPAVAARPIRCRTRAGSTTRVSTTRPRAPRAKRSRSTATADAGARRARRDPARAISPDSAIPPISARPASRSAAVDARPLDTRERLELTIGQAEVAVSRRSVRRRRRAVRVGRSIGPWCSAPPAHERVLDWWATALDRHAQRAAARGSPAYLRPDRRPHARRARDRCGIDAGELLAGGRRARRRRSRSAWQAAIAGWVRASARAAIAAPRCAPTSIAS